MRVVRGAVLDGPILQHRGNGIGRRRIERLAARDRRAQRAIRPLRQPRLLYLIVEGERAELLDRFGGGERDGPAFGQRLVANALHGVSKCSRSHGGGSSFQMCGGGRVVRRTHYARELLRLAIMGTFLGRNPLKKCKVTFRSCRVCTFYRSLCNFRYPER